MPRTDPSRAHRVGPRRPVSGGLLVALAAVCLTPAASGGAAEVRLPPQGMYEGCAPGAPGAACAARLAEIRSAGFRYVLNYSSWYGSPAEVLRYADVAAGLGLELIWPLNHPAWRGLADFASTYPDLTGKRVAPRRAALPGARTRPSAGAGLVRLAAGEAGATSQAIRLVADHPATWGYYIGDELPPREAGRVRALSARARALAPDKSQLYVARPGARRLAPFAGIADVAGASVYPLGSGDPAVSAAARSVDAVTSAAGIQTAMVLQAFAWSHYRPARPCYPTAARLRAMRDAAIHSADPDLILWYSYQDIVRSDDPELRWGALSRASFAPLTAPATSKGNTRRCARSRMGQRAGINPRIPATHSYN